MSPPQRPTLISSAVNMISKVLCEAKNATTVSFLRAQKISLGFAWNSTISWQRGGHARNSIKPSLGRPHPPNHNNTKAWKKLDQKKKKTTREGNFIEVRRTNDKIIPMGRPFVWPDEKLWGGKSLFTLTDRFTLIHLTPEAERATLSAWSFAYNQKTQPFFEHAVKDFIT